MGSEIKRRNRYTNDDLINEAKKYNTRQEMKAGSPKQFSCIYNRKMMELAFCHMEKYGYTRDGVPVKWTAERALSAAKACGATSLYDWHNRDHTSYAAACRLGVQRHIATVRGWKIG